MHLLSRFISSPPINNKAIFLLLLQNQSGTCASVSIGAQIAYQRVSSCSRLRSGAYLKCAMYLHGNTGWMTTQVRGGSLTKPPRFPIPDAPLLYCECPNPRPGNEYRSEENSTMIVPGNKMRKKLVKIVKSDWFGLLWRVLNSETCCNETVCKEGKH